MADEDHREKRREKNGGSECKREGEEAVEFENLKQESSDNSGLGPLVGLVDGSSLGTPSRAGSLLPLLAW